MTKCYYCSKPMMTTARFADGTLVTVCEEHYFRHLDRAKAREEMKLAERAARHAMQEEANWAAVRRRAVDVFYEAKRKLH